MIVQEFPPTRVLLGFGSRRHIAEEVARIGADRVLLIATRSAANAASQAEMDLVSKVAARFDGPVVHTPTSVTAAALELLPSPADAVVAIGGGAAIGLSKAIAIRTGAKQIVVPTTYAGSEVTPVLGETEDGVKRTRRDPQLVPDTVIYDPELTLTMPLGLSLTSAINALAHSVEALWAANATPLSDALATESATRILSSAPVLMDDLSDRDAREDLQYAAWLAGMCLAHTQMGLHHQLAHVLGGRFNLPHAELHAMLLGHVMKYNLPAAPSARERLASITGGNPADFVVELAGRHDGATTLADLGVPRAELRDVARTVADAPYPNPRLVEVDAIEEVLNACWAGA